MMVASIPVGKTIDRIGPKIPLTLAPIVLAASTAIFAYGSFFTVMISMCLNGLVFLLLMSSAMTLTASLVGPENRGKVRGFLNFTGYIFTGVGMLLGNFFYNLYPPLPFFITITLSLPMVLIIAFRVHEPDAQAAH